LSRNRPLIGAVVVAVVATAAVVGGVSLWRWTSPPTLPASASPQTVARTYLELDAAGRSWAAKRLVWDAERSEAPDGRGYGSVRLIHLSKPYPIDKQGYGPQYAGLAELCSVKVDYHRTREDDVGNPPGDDVTSVLLGRETPTSAWRVLDVGFPL
jgi:hypothetical protein